MKKNYQGRKKTEENLEENKPWYSKDYSSKPVHTSHASDYMKNKSVKLLPNKVNVTHASHYVIKHSNIVFMNKCIQRLRRRN